ncbi:MAG TPA: ABC transporter substrate-binding protein [Chloroflexota bacterium]|jgi:NitT/TauT family transport system substrate-binding protein|nr:ABC transporter substrate-binding protein [Chloroflexota bacterium]
MSRHSLHAVGIGCLVLLSVLGACAPSASRPSGASEAPRAAAPPAGAAAQTGAPAPPEHIRISYAGLTAHFAAAWVPKEAGYFAQQGLDAEVTYLPSRQASAALVSGEADYAFFSGRTLVDLRIQGADVVAIAAPMTKLILSLIVQPDIQRPEDLRGKRMGVTGFGSIIDFGGRYLLKELGLQPEVDVAVIQLQTNPNIMAALESHAIEAGALAPPQSLQALAQGYRELAAMHRQPFEYPANIVAVRGDRLRERPDQVRRVVRAVTEGIARIKNDPPYAQAVLKQYTSIEDPEALKGTYDLFAPAFPRLPLLTEAALQVAIDETAAENPRAREVTPASAMDMRFVQEIEASGLLHQLYP